MFKEFLMTALATSAVFSSVLAQKPEGAKTQIARWKDNAKGVIVFYYDDGTGSALSFAVPTLEKYGVDGTFYIAPGWFEKTPEKLDVWIDAAKNPCIHLANHTWMHSGAKNLEEAESEIAKADDVLRSHLGFPKNKLMSFSHPGGTPWAITQDQEHQLAAKYSLISRPHGAKGVAGPKHDVKNAQDAIARLDLAEKSGELTFIMFHGVGGDWFKFPAADHEILIREVARRKTEGRIWAPATIDAQKYEAERNSASITNTTSADSLSFELVVTTDPVQYDVPLTLVSPVPADWESAVIQQDQRSFKAPVHQGVLTYDVNPVSSRITVSQNR